MLIIEWDRPKSFLGSMVFSVFPYLFEPGDFKGFLRLDWSRYLERHGLKLQKIVKSRFHMVPQFGVMNIVGEKPTW